MLIWEREKEKSTYHTVHLRDKIITVNAYIKKGIPQGTRKVKQSRPKLAEWKNKYHSRNE